MKTLYLVRHGKSQKKDQGKNDFKRTLIKKGKSDSAKMAKRLRKMGVETDLLITSSAKRAWETCQIFADEFKMKKKAIVHDDSVYEGNDADTLLTLIKNLDPAYNAVMLFGHEPGFSLLAASLIRNFDFLIPKSGVVAIHFNTEWEMIRRLSGKLQFFCFPMTKELKKKYQQQILKPLETKIIDQVNIKLGQIDKEITAQMSVEIEAFAEVLVKDLYKKRGSYVFRNINEIKDFYHEEESADETASTEVKSE